MKTKAITDCPCRFTLAPIGIFALLLLVGAFVAPAPAAAQLQAINGCMQDVYENYNGGGTLNCTANDVSVASVTDINILDDGCQFVGDTVTFSADYEILLTAQARHDIGIYFSTDGEDALGTVGPVDGNCEIVTLPIPPTDLDGTADTGFYCSADSGTTLTIGPGGLPLPCNADGPPDCPDGDTCEEFGTGIQDTCGDIDNDPNPIILQDIVITAECQDPDNDGRLDLPNCTSWRQPGDNDLCLSPIAAFPGAPSKCRCDPGLDIGICVPGFCDDGNVCTDDVCTINPDTGDAECSNPPAADSTPCEDGDFCTSETGTPQTPDHCESGVCVGVPVSCPGDQCNVGVCNPDDGACFAVPVEDSTPCEDGSYCTSETGTVGTPDHCESGVCVGVPVDCGPGDQCNDNVCNEATDTCEFVPFADSTPCEDGSFCTSETGTVGTPDHCESGTCVGVPVDCGPGDQCNDDICNEDTDACEVVPKADSTPCEDGSFCTSETGTVGTPDHCESGTCVGVPVDCGPGDQCNDDVCNEDTDACEVVPKADSTPCEDGSFCTSETGTVGTPDHCETGVCVGIPVDCGPGDQCNDDVCNEDTDACEVVPKADSTPCEDGSFCTSETGTVGTPDHCETGVCVGIPVDCGPGDQCNDDVCNEDTDACEVVPKADSTPCEDGSFCTSETGTVGTPDHCETGVCVGIPVDCGPGDQCNDDVCNEDTDACEVVPKADSTPCEDGSFCTSETGTVGTPDHCETGVCVGIPVDCGPGDQCNDDVCNEDTDACEVVPKADSTPCEDGSFCTSETGAVGTPDHCETGVCVGIPVDCGPGDQCNDDVCNEDTDACEVVPKADSTPCEDGSFCTSETGAVGTPDHCETGVCVGIPVDCGPGDQCNDDVCNEDTDACEVVPKADSTPCEDGSFCTSETGTVGTPDHCETGVCVGIPVDCGPGDQCNDKVCNEASNTCDVIPKADSTPCEDGSFCTSETGTVGTPDHCESGTCVGVPVDCGPGDDCNDNVCNEDDDACGFVPVENSTPCEDGDFCTSETGTPQTPDHCFDGVCTGVDVDCSGEDDECNVGTCDETDGACFADPEPKEGDFCGDGSDTICTDPDTCESGICVPNNEPCGFVTDSGLCTFDVGDVCGTGDENREFRLVYTPDVKSWPAHKLNASNPGQTYYNLFYEGDPTTLTISIPWPYVSHGAMPLHIYDGDLVHTNHCFEPPEEALDALGVYITLDDWATGGTNDSGVTCDMVTSYLDLAPDNGYCTFDVVITDEMLEASGQVYVNYHLDYGLKGKNTDANPIEPPDYTPDRYDPGANVTTGGWDALFDTELGTGAIGMPDCNLYDFSHDDGDSNFFTDTVASTNDFKRIAGAIGQGLKSNNGEAAKDVEVLLIRNDSGEIVQSGLTDQDGFYALPYKHKGKPAWYSVIARDGECEALLGEYELGHQVELQGNGWVDVQFDTYYCSSTAEYGSGRNKGKK